jgi:hypothetical protein
MRPVKATLQEPQPQKVQLSRISKIYALTEPQSSVVAEQQGAVNVQPCLF